MTVWTKTETRRPGHDRCSNSSPAPIARFRHQAAASSVSLAGRFPAPERRDHMKVAGSKCTTVSGTSLSPGQVFNAAPLHISDRQIALTALYERLKPQPQKRRADLRTIGQVPEGKRHSFLLSIAGQFRARGMDAPEILAAIREVNKSRCNPPKTDQKLREIVDYVCSKPAGFQWRAKPNNGSDVQPMPPEKTRADEEKETRPPDLLTSYDPEDVGNGQRLVAMHGKQLRYCHTFRSWLAWDGCRWRIDPGDSVVRKLAQDTMKEFALQAVKANNEPLTKFAAHSRRSARISNAIAEAKPHLGISTQSLDTEPHVLNFLNGTVDLRNGELHTHNHAQYITKLVHHSYDSSAKCPTFFGFLGQITT
jgi:putative DNA primase/helicase